MGLVVTFPAIVPLTIKQDDNRFSFLDPRLFVTIEAAYDSICIMM